MLISSRNILKDQSENDVLPAIWAPLSQLKMTHKINHHRNNNRKALEKDRQKVNWAALLHLKGHKCTELFSVPSWRHSSPRSSEDGGFRWIKFLFHTMTTSDGTRRTASLQYSTHRVDDGLFWQPAYILTIVYSSTQTAPDYILCIFTISSWCRFTKLKWSWPNQTKYLLQVERYLIPFWCLTGIKKRPLLEEVRPPMSPGWPKCGRNNNLQDLVYNQCQNSWRGI